MPADALRGALARAGSPPSTDDRATIARLAEETEVAAKGLREKVDDSPEQIIAVEALLHEKGPPKRAFL